MIYYLKKVLLLYLIIVGLVLHAALMVVFVFYPGVIYSVESKVYSWIDKNRPNKYNINEEIYFSFGSWYPEDLIQIGPGKILIGDREFSSLQLALDNIQAGDTLELGSGVYKTPVTITKDRVTVVGKGRVVFDGAVAEGKAAFVIKGDDFKLYNIECKGIEVSDQNGACVRMEGTNLVLRHVYFHNSEEGVLTGYKPGFVKVEDSRFELLGKGGQAHGIYMGEGDLHIEDSLFIAAVDEGHEIKSRAKTTKILRTVVASLSSNDSRLIDISNGGVLIVTDSILEKGPRSSNADLIGFGLEGSVSNNHVELKNNIFIMERDGFNNLFHAAEGLVDPIIDSNVVVSNNDPDIGGLNIWYKNREKAGLKSYPFVPVLGGE